MAVENLKDSLGITGRDSTPVDYPDPGLSGGVLRRVAFLVEVSAAASATSTYLIARLPSSARLSDLSYISCDDLATTGSPTFDIGVFNPSDRTSNTITDDDDAINDGIGVAAAALRGTKLIKTIDNVHKRLWEHVNGQATDPGGELDVKITLKDAATDSGGTVQGEIFYTCN